MAGAARHSPPQPPASLPIGPVAVLTSSSSPEQSAGRGHARPLPARERHRDGCQARRGFRRSVAFRAITRGKRHGCPTALQGLRWQKSHSYSPHTPGPGPQPLVPVTRARSSHRLRPAPSQVSGGLRPAVHVARGFHPRPTPYVRFSRRHSHLAAKGKLWPIRTQKLSATPRCGLFAVRHRLRRDSLASACRSRLSRLSSSRPPFSRAVPVPSGRHGLSRYRGQRSPRQPRRAGTLSPHPTDGILTRFAPPRPSLNGRRVPVAPVRGQSHRIERPVCLRVMNAAFVRTSLRRTTRAVE